MRYAVYGVTLASDVPLALPPAGDKSPTDVHLRKADDGTFDAARAMASPPPPGDWMQHAVLDDGSMFLRWEDWLEIIVAADGRLVHYHRLTDDMFDGFEAYIANFAVSAALVQQGEEPLHATVVQMAGRTVGFLGDSGAGKSTLAAYLIDRGARLVTDDMLRITLADGVALAHPGPLTLKLLEEPAARYLLGARTRGQWNPFANKYLIEVGPSTALQHSVPLAALYWLDAPPADCPSRAVMLDRLQGLELFKTISASTMNSRLNSPARLERQLRFAERLGRTLPVYRLTYPRRHEVFAEVVDVLEWSHG